MSGPADAHLLRDLQSLASTDRDTVARLVNGLAAPMEARREPGSDVVPSEDALRRFRGHLVVHHLLSRHPFRRERFEHALEAVARREGRDVTWPESRTHRGYDMLVDGERWSLKTQADKAIKRDEVLISKWMELGKGQWGEDPAALERLRGDFVARLEGYDRVLALRCLTPGDDTIREYELIEVPKSLFDRVAEWPLTMMHDSTQDNKPGRCEVTDSEGLVYALYFDGGSERKLQVQHLRTDVCIPHAAWAIDLSTLTML